MHSTGNISCTDQRKVVVTGVGVLTSIGAGNDAFLSNLRLGSSGIKPIHAFDTNNHRCKVGGEISDFSPERYFGTKDLRRMDRASQLLLAAADEAVAAANLEFSKQDPTRCGTVVGTTLGGMASGEKYHRLLALKRRRRPSLLLDFPAHAPTDHLCISYGLHGPCFTVSTACASGAQAVGCAFDLLRAGEADVFLAGGVDTMAELTQSGFGVLKLLVGEGEQIRPFDRNRSGFALGEGAAILVLEEKERARERGAPIYAEIGGYGLTNDAYHMTAPEPQGRGAAKAMTDALNNAGLHPRQVQYINAHGTATRHNDVSETRAIRKVFEDYADQLPVSSIKSMIGHTLGGAGAIELAATILAMRAGFVPPTINYDTRDPDCDLDYVTSGARSANVQVAISNSFGFGGINCSIVVTSGHNC